MVGAGQVAFDAGENYKNFDEKKLLWDGLREKEKTTSELLMEGFKEEQIIRKLEEEDD